MYPNICITVQHINKIMYCVFVKYIDTNSDNVQIYEGRLDNRKQNVCTRLSRHRMIKNIKLVCVCLQKHQGGQQGNIFKCL